jgi:hypothetical protein
MTNLDRLLGFRATQAERIASQFGGFFGDCKRLSKDGQTIVALAGMTAVEVEPKDDGARLVYRFADHSWLSIDARHYTAGS